MEVNLTYVFIATVSFALLLIALLGLLLNKNKQMNISISEQNAAKHNQRVQIIKKLSTSTDLRFDGVTTKQNENIGLNVLLLIF